MLKNSSWSSSKPLHPKVVVTSSEDEEDTEELVPQKKVSAFKLEEMKETGGEGNQGLSDNGVDMTSGQGEK